MNRDTSRVKHFTNQWNSNIFGKLPHVNNHDIWSFFDVGLHHPLMASAQVVSCDFTNQKFCAKRLPFRRCFWGWGNIRNLARIDDVSSFIFWHIKIIRFNMSIIWRYSLAISQESPNVPASLLALFPTSWKTTTKMSPGWVPFHWCLPHRGVVKWPCGFHGSRILKVSNQEPEIDTHGYPPGNDETYPTKREKENHRLKSTFGKGYAIVSRRVCKHVLNGLQFYIP